MFRFEGLFTDRLPLSGQPGLLRPLSAALLAGIITGAAAWLLKWLIKNISKIVTSEFDITGGNWHLILVAIMGIMLVGWLVRHVVRMPLEHATRQLKKNIAQKHGNMPGRLVVAPVAASALTLGCGGSAGAEGPISYTGAAIASNIARITGIGKEQLLTYMACGAGAGIAAIFKAPVGGMFFTIEVLNIAMGVVPMVLHFGTYGISAKRMYSRPGDCRPGHFVRHALVSCYYSSRAGMRGIFRLLQDVRIIYLPDGGIHKTASGAQPGVRHIARGAPFYVSGSLRRGIRRADKHSQRRHGGINQRQHCSNNTAQMACGICPWRNSSDKGHSNIRHQFGRRCCRRFCAYPVCRRYSRGFCLCSL